MNKDYGVSLWWRFKDLFRWAGWNLWYLPIRAYYLITNKQQKFGSIIDMIWRTRPLWSRFKPHIWHNNAGRLWEIFLDDSRCYCELTTLPVDVMRDIDTGNIVGIKIYDEVIENPDYYKAPYPHQKFKDATSSNDHQKQHQATAQ